MDLLLVTGRFPERSETFIYRKAVGLANRGHRVTMAVREIGDWTLYPDQLPATFRVEELLPDGRLRVPSRAIRAATGAAQLACRAPSETRRVYGQCTASPEGRPGTLRRFLRHLPFVGRKAEIVHFEFLSLAAMYPLTRSVVGAPVIVSCRGSELHNLALQADRDREASLAWLRDADAIHCVSAELAQEIEHLVGRRDGVWINRPAVDVDAIAVRAHELARSPVHLVTVGRLVWKKGLDHLLAALATLARRNVPFHLDILGDGELKHFLRFSIGDLGLERHVTLVGGVAPLEVLAHIQEADAFVLASHQEGISNAALEAMAAGLPIVTTNAGGMAEAVRDGIEGFVVPVRDVAALADRLERLVGAPALRTTMGAAARARAVSEFSLARQLATFEAMYRATREAHR